MRVAVLVACYNRRDVTISGLRALVNSVQGLSHTDFSFYVVDDASPDGTGKAVEAEFPFMSVLEGTGSLFWAGGMAKAFEAALAAEGEHDAFLLFNDDVSVRDSAVRAFVESYLDLNRLEPTILAGRCVSSSGDLTYGGFVRSSRFRPMGFSPVAEVSSPVRIDTFNGNFVMIPAVVLRALQGVDAKYRHGYADLDIGLRAGRLGVPSLLYPTPVGVCERGASVAEQVRNAPLARRWSLLFSGPTGLRPYVSFASSHSQRWLLPLYVVQETAVRLRALVAPSSAR